MNGEMDLIEAPLLEVRDLKVTYEAQRGSFFKHVEYVHAVKGVSFKVENRKLANPEDPHPTVPCPSHRADAQCPAPSIVPKVD
jgi:hypothetical protein